MGFFGEFASALLGNFGRAGKGRHHGGMRPHRGRGRGHGPGPAHRGPGHGRGFHKGRRGHWAEKRAERHKERAEKKAENRKKRGERRMHRRKKFQKRMRKMGPAKINRRLAKLRNKRRCGKYCQWRIKRLESQLPPAPPAAPAPAPTMSGYFGDWSYV